MSNGNRQAAKQQCGDWAFNTFQMPLSIANDESLSWSARGIVGHLLSSATREFNIRELTAKSPSPREVVFSAVLELKRAGYLIDIPGGPEHSTRFRLAPRFFTETDGAQ